MMELQKMPSYYADVKKDLKCNKAPSLESVAFDEEIILDNNVAVERNITSPVMESSELETMRKLYQTEVEKAEIRKQNLMREKELMEEVFEAKEKILQAEMKLALSRLETGGCGLTFNDRLLKTEERETSRVYPDLSLSPMMKLPYTQQEDIVVPTPTELKVESSAPPMQPVLGQLMSLERVTVHQMPTHGLDDSYEVRGPDGSVVLRVTLSLGRLEHLLVGMKRALTVDMVDELADETVTFRPAEYGSMELQVGKERALVVRRVPTLLKPVLSINDALGTMLLKVKGPAKRNTKNGFFSVETVNKIRIGCIEKGLYVTSGVSTIVFPRDLDVRCKAAIIGCNFLIITREQAKMRDHKIDMALKSAYYAKYATEDLA